MRAAGPLGRYIHNETNDEHFVFGHGTGANAQTLLRRVAWDGAGDDKVADKALLQVAAARMFPNDILGAANRRRAAAIARLEERGAFVWRFDASPTGRMIIGHGDENPRENGFRLHGTYGTPIIPGQALKGVARAAAREADNRDDEAVVFGDQSRAAVMFLDALPLPRGDHRVTPDVLTPHGAEWKPPNIVFFLTATKNITFRVHIVALNRTGDIPTGVLSAEEWLVKGLKDIGVGAKASSGYGYMKVGTVPD